MNLIIYFVLAIFLSINSYSGINEPGKGEFVDDCKKNIDKSFNKGLKKGKSKNNTFYNVCE